VTIPLSLAMMLVNLGTLGAVANGLGPLKNGHLTVHGSHDPDELGLECRWSSRRSRLNVGPFLTMDYLPFDRLHRPGFSCLRMGHPGVPLAEDRRTGPALSGGKDLLQARTRGRPQGLGASDGVPVQYPSSVAEVGS